MTISLMHILSFMLEEPRKARYGLEIAGKAGLKTGTIYPALGRLEEAGWVESAWESVDPSSAGRPRRRLYVLTGVGEIAARDAVTRHLETISLRPRAGLGSILRPEGQLS